MDEKQMNVPIPVGEVFPEALEELTNGKGPAETDEAAK